MSKLSKKAAAAHSAFLPASTGFLIGLFFNPVDGGNMFLQNIGPHLNYITLQHKTLFSCHKHLKSNKEKIIY
jgi:hypothetical protein